MKVEVKFESCSLNVRRIDNGYIVDLSCKEDFDGKNWIGSRVFDSYQKAEIAMVCLRSQFVRGYFDLLEWKMLTQSCFYLLDVKDKEKSLIVF